MPLAAVAVRTAVLLAVLCPSLAACSPHAPLPLTRLTADSSASLAVDGAQRFQTIDGFGVNANSLSWDNGALVPALDQLTDTMGASVWRVIVESTQGWEDIPDAGDANTYNWSYYDQFYATPKFQALWGVLGYLQQKRVPTVMLNVMGCPPSWMGGCAIDPSDEDHYVKMEASLLYYAHTVKHLRIDVVSPMNEEDLGNPEGPYVTSAQYVRILDKLSAQLDTIGLHNIQLLGPDTASLSAATSDYMPALLSDSRLMAKIEHFGLHDYGGNASDAARVIAGSAYSNRTFWMTEYSASCNGCDNGAPNPNNWDFATGTLDCLFAYIEQGASSALVYDGYDSYYEHHGSMGYWGLLGYDASARKYTPRKQFYTLAQVVKFVRPGMVRIGAVSSDDAERVFAFTDPATGALTIVGRNANSAPETLRGTLAHVLAVDRLALYQTTQNANMTREPDLPVSDGAFTAEIAPDSVFTLTSLPFVASLTHVATPVSVPAATPTPTPIVGAVTLGNSIVGSAIDSRDSNYLNGSRFTTGAAGGSVATMSVHVGNVSPAPNDQYELAIYTDEDGSPHNLVAHSGLGTLTSSAWNTMSIHATLSPNTAYWLMYNTNGASDTANNMNFTAGDGVPEAYSADAVPFGDWPSTFGNANMGAGAFSIYATYTAAPGSASAANRTTPTQAFGVPALLLIGLLATVASAILAGLLAGHRLTRRRGWVERLRGRS